MVLTEAKLAKRPKGRVTLFDGKVRGLLARHGTRTGWVFAFQGRPTLGPDGKRVRPRATLGRWSPVPGFGLSLKEARKKAAALLGEEGYRTPATAANVGETVRGLAEHFLAARYAANATRGAKVRALLECHALPGIGGMAIKAVTREHCFELVREAAKERRVETKGSVRRGGRAPALALIRILRQLFEHAVVTGKLSTLAESPAALLDAKHFGIPTAEPRDRWLSAEELTQLFLHREVDLPGLVAGRPGPEFGLSLAVRGAIILGPHLAVRPKALLGLRWDEVDFERATVTIRGGRGAKQKHGTRVRDFVVPLSTTTVEVLRALERSGGSRPWVFPSASAAGHLSGDVLADAMKRLSTRLQLPGGPVRPHDARRTFGNTAINLKVERLVVERCLQHSLGKVGDTYLGDTVERLRREAHERVDEHWTSVRGGKLATVVPIAKR